MELRHLIGVGRKHRERCDDRDDGDYGPAPQPPEGVGCGERALQRSLLAVRTGLLHLPEPCSAQERDHRREVSSRARR
jgi:hypothetical protein